MFLKAKKNQKHYKTNLNLKKKNKKMDLKGENFDVLQFATQFLHVSRKCRA